MAIIGAFMFRNEGDDCLGSKYFNNTLDQPLMECSRRINLIEGNPFVTPDDNYAGYYTTVWLENNTKAIQGDLMITKRTESIYTLQWTEKSNPAFKGEAMMVDGLLVGWYTDMQNPVNNLT